MAKYDESSSAFSCKRNKINFIFRIHVADRILKTKFFNIQKQTIQP